MAVLVPEVLVGALCLGERPLRLGQPKVRVNSAVA